MAVVCLRVALGLALLVWIGAAAAASGAPVANEKTYIDERGEHIRGEDVDGPDITSVVVSNDDSGLITFRLLTPNRQRLTQDMRVRIAFTVRGTFYFLLVDPYKPPTVRVALYGCEQQASGMVCGAYLAPPLPSLRFRYVRGARFTFDLSELGIEPTAGTRARITFYADIYSGLRFVPGRGFDFTESTSTALHLGTHERTPMSPRSAPASFGRRASRSRPRPCPSRRRARSAPCRSRRGLAPTSSA